MAKNANGFISIDTEIHADTMGLKSVLRKLQNFVRYSASIGIHKGDAVKKVYRRYTNIYGQARTSGITARMTIGKLAWQNEMGAHIMIKPQYATYRRERTFEKRLTRDGNGLLRRSRVWYFTAPSGKQRGYVIKSKVKTDKNGNPKWVTTLPVGGIITIPQRPIFRTFVQKHSAKINSFITKTCQSMFTKKGLRVHAGISSMSKFITQILKMELNAGDTKANHPITQEVKGFNHPLLDEEGRIAKHVTYKIYRDKDVPGTNGYIQWNKQQARYYDQLLKSVQQLENLGIKRSYVRVKSYQKTQSEGWALEKGVVNAKDKDLDVLYPRVQQYSPTLNSPDYVPKLHKGVPVWHAKETYGPYDNYRKPTNYRRFY